MLQQRYLSFGQQPKYKLIIVGDSGVGKTSLFWRFTDGQLQPTKQTDVTTVDFRIKNITLKGRKCKLYIWDTAGQQRHRSIVSTYFKGCHGVMLVFDSSTRASFRNATQQWLNLINSKAQSSVMVVVQNKIDLTAQVPEAQVRQFCDKLKVQCYRTSVRQNKGVDQAFMALAQLVVQKAGNTQTIDRSQSFNLKGKKKGQKQQKKKCCG